MRFVTRRLCLLTLLVLVGASLLIGGSEAAAPASRPSTTRVETARSSFRSRSNKKKAIAAVAEQSRLSKSILDKRATNKIPRGGEVADTLPNALAGAAVLALIEQVTKVALQKADITFPSMLAGCIGLFLALILTEVVSPSTAAAIFNALTPAAAFLTKWMGPLFVPGLVMLPLAPSVGGGAEIAKVVGTISIGWVYSILTTTFVVIAVRKAQGTMTYGEVVKKPVGVGGKPYSPTNWNLVWKGTVVTGIASILATRAKNAYATPLEMIFLSFLTLSTYVWGANLPSSFTKVVHPLVTGSVMVLASLYGLGKATDREFIDVVKAYRVKSLDPMKMGAGDLLMYILGPSVVSFAVSMYSRRELLFKNLFVVVAAMLTASAGGLFGTAAFCRLVALGGTIGDSAKLLRLSVLSRNITTALALALTNMIGGDIAIAASVVCLTGILGGTYGKSLLDKLGVRDPICRGLGMGGSSQGLGVAALADEPEAFPFAAIAMVVTAISATTLAAIPSVQKALIGVATGGITTPVATPTP